MFAIMEKELLAPGIHRLEVLAPLVASKAKAGNFVMVRVHSGGERIPFTIAGNNPKAGTIMLVVQEAGKSTKAIGALQAGDTLLDVVGPLGTPTHIEPVKSLVGVCGGIGVAPTLPLLKAFRAKGTEIVTIMGARNKDLFILRDEVEAVSDEVIYVTDDGSFGAQGLVTDALTQLLEEGRKFDQAIAIGPARMMQATCKVTEYYGVPTIVSLNAIMVDGTGMCGACRVTVGGETKFTCVEGPDFDGHKVDFEELILRQAFYREEERGGENCQCHSS
ncbi:MAG: sulfide/dihydroorotate dehydrogenase-like FAD/NAD-binding protein [Firmicutes bacterium]|nr:sulfide/dihydroorotate dehydrogenase-like FAD/NAD-binding protein [Bacillota bacterium]